jgi:hypothetical protein
VFYFGSWRCRNERIPRSHPIYLQNSAVNVL